VDTIFEEIKAEARLSFTFSKPFTLKKKESITLEKASKITEIAHSHCTEATFPTKNSVKLFGIPSDLTNAEAAILKYLYETTTEEVTVPPEWTPQEDQLIIVPLNSTDTEYTKVATRFFQSIPMSSNIRITKIERVQNTWLWEKYAQEKNTMEKKNMGVIVTNERELFHGTCSTQPQLIFNGQDGWDRKFANAGLWGDGLYFATNAVYSLDYKFTVSTKVYQMFLAKVLIGDTIDVPANSSLKMPPVKPKSTGPGSHLKFEVARYDSVTAVTATSVNYVVYDNGRAYPAYLITFTM